MTNQSNCKLLSGIVEQLKSVEEGCQEAIQVLEACHKQTHTIPVAAVDGKIKDQECKFVATKPGDTVLCEDTSEKKKVVECRLLKGLNLARNKITSAFKVKPQDCHEFSSYTLPTDSSISGPSGYTSEQQSKQSSLHTSPAKVGGFKGVGADMNERPMLHGCFTADPSRTPSTNGSEADESQIETQQVPTRSRSLSPGCCRSGPFQCSVGEAHHRDDGKCRVRIGGHGRFCKAVPKSCLKIGGIHALTHLMPPLKLIDPKLRGEGVMAPPASGAATLRRQVNGLQSKLESAIDNEHRLVFVNNQLRKRLEICLEELQTDSVQQQLDSLHIEMEQTIELLHQLAERNGQLEKEKKEFEDSLSGRLRSLEKERSSLQEERGTMMARIDFLKDKLQPGRRLKDSSKLPAACPAVEQVGPRSPGGRRHWHVARATSAESESPTPPGSR